MSASDTQRTHDTRGDADAGCWCELHTEAGPAGDILVLRVCGEIDTVTLPAVRSALTAAANQRPGDLVVDLAAVTFCCVRGFALLADVACTAQASGIGYAVSGLSTHLDRVATLLWPEQRCVRYRSVAAAVTAIRIDQTTAASDQGRPSPPPHDDPRAML